MEVEGARTDGTTNALGRVDGASQRWCDGLRSELADGVCPHTTCVVQGARVFRIRMSRRQVRWRGTGRAPRRARRVPRYLVGRLPRRRRLVRRAPGWRDGVASRCAGVRSCGDGVGCDARLRRCRDGRYRLRPGASGRRECRTGCGIRRGRRSRRFRVRGACCPPCR
jgi:hypothetical protein